MNEKQKIIISSVLSSLFVFGTLIFAYHYKQIYDRAQFVRKASKDLRYYAEAEIINDYFSRFDKTTRIKVIREALISIDKLLPKYFPDGPFVRNDLIAIAVGESNFNQYLIGSKKEFGIFQILPESCEWGGIKRSQFDIEVNTELALFVLKKKYDSCSDYKMAIIAYNGVVKTSKGKISEVYWDKFIKNRKLVDDLLGIPSK